MSKSRIAIVVDCSGSMSGQIEQTTTNINEMVEKLQRDVPGKAKLEVYTFHDRVNSIYSGKLADAEKFTQGDFECLSVTALYDAMGKAVEGIRGKMKEGDKASLIVETDGMENASTEYTQASIKALMGILEKDDAWSVEFMTSAPTENASAAIAANYVQTLGVQAASSDHAGRGHMYGTATANVSGHLRR